MSEVCNAELYVWADEGWINAIFHKFTNFLSNTLGGFGNLILYFNWEGDYTNPFEETNGPLDLVEGFFDGLIEYLSTVEESLTSVLDSITGGLDILDRFTSRFKWVLGLCVFALAILVVSRFIGL